MKSAKYGDLIQIVSDIEKIRNKYSSMSEVKESVMYYLKHGEFDTSNVLYIDYRLYCLPFYEEANPLWKKIDQQVLSQYEDDIICQLNFWDKYDSETEVCFYSLSQKMPCRYAIVNILFALSLMDEQPNDEKCFDFVKDWLGQFYEDCTSLFKKTKIEGDYAKKIIISLLDKMKDIENKKIDGLYDSVFDDIGFDEDDAKLYMYIQSGDSLFWPLYSRLKSGSFYSDDCTVRFDTPFCYILGSLAFKKIDLQIHWRILYQKEPIGFQFDNVFLKSNEIGNVKDSLCLLNERLVSSIYVENIGMNSETIKYITDERLINKIFESNDEKSILKINKSLTFSFVIQKGDKKTAPINWNLFKKQKQSLRFSDYENQKNGTMIPLKKILKKVELESKKPEDVISGHLIDFEISDISTIRRKPSDFEKKEMSEYKLRKMTKPALLINDLLFDVSQIAFVYCEASEEMPLYVPHYYSIFEVTDKEVLLEYLYVMLKKTKDSIVNNMEEIERGIYRCNWLDVEIDYDEDINKQQLEIDLYKISCSENLVKDYEELLDRKRREFEQLVRIRKHAIGHYTSSLNADVNTLYNYWNNHELVSLSDPIGAKSGRTSLDFIKSIRSLTETIGNEINNLTSNLEFDDSHKKHIKLETFISDYMKDKESISYEKKCSIFPGFGTKMSEKDLRRLFDDVVNNAVIHGFTDESRTDYKIRFMVEYEKETKEIVLSISNNGNLMPDGMVDRYSDMGEKAGKTGHTGIGGYEVKLIAEHYGGRVCVKSDPDAEFPVSINVYLPLDVCF